ncbi:FadR family transcriptional regulator [Bacillus salacetis]|uniref:FadR family transcriptional regulator n=1 Tax=Bacillus salacetis TaxID=2315464 RepID=A0A3A1QWX8_9BACI|nr:GntR family transcriptional regulator [Bacillus salacetis]RIW29702.1 FadR family transcriptional regulator [Bacillus salacetis]
MDAAKPNSKVFIEIVDRIRDMISNDDLQPGDKIPSERELSERLKAGRSSIREALRALELLGLIETRRGEGTFLKDFRNHHLVELLGTFILKDDKARGDVLLTKEWIEKESLRTLFHSGTNPDFLQSWIDSEGIHTVDGFLRKIIHQSNNLLGEKIWYILSQYGSVGQNAIPMNEKCIDACKGLLNSLKERDEDKMWEFYHLLKD